MSHSPLSSLKKVQLLKCINCFFYRVKSHGEWAVCYRHPPKQEGGFPIVRPDDFCGEYWNRTTPYVLSEEYFK